jgi:cbb3-type cytochrome oxidase maturation protein
VSIILVLIPLSILFAVAFLAAFIWAVRSGQYEDTCTPSMRLLLDDPATKPQHDKNSSNTKKPNNDEP